MNSELILEEQLAPPSTGRLARHLDRQVEVNRALAERLRAQAAALNVLGSAAEALAIADDPEAKIDDAFSRCIEASGAASGALYLTCVRGELTMRARSGFASVRPEELTSLFGHAEVFRRALAQQEPLVLQRGETDALAADLLERARSSFAVIAPVRGRGEELGAVLLCAEEQTGRDLVAFAQAIALQLGLALSLGRALRRAAASDARWRTLTENANDAIFVLSTEGRVLDANRRAEKLHGASREALRGRRFLEFVAPVSRDAARTGFAACLTRGHSTDEEIQIVRADGARAVVDFSAAVVDVQGEKLVIAIARDVTDRMRMSRRLGAQHAVTAILDEGASLEQAATGLLRSLCEAEGWQFGALWRVDSESGLLCCHHTWQKPELSQFAASRTGRTVVSGSELPGAAWASSSVTTIEEIAAGDDAFLKTRAAPLGLRSGIALPVLVGGRVLAVLEFLACERIKLDPDLEIRLAVLGGQLAQFIKRWNAELALSESEALARSLVDSDLLGVSIVNLEGHVLHLNDTWLRMFGYTREEFESGAIRWPEMTPAEWAHTDLEAIAELRRVGRAGPWRKECMHKDGRRIPILIGVSMLGGRGDRCAAFMLDLSETQRAEQAQKSAEAQLREAHKMEAVGQLAGGIAHDFNNLMTIVVTNAGLVLDELPSDAPIAEEIREIRGAGERAAALTRQLLAFGRRQVLELKIHPLDEIVGGVGKMLRRVIPENVAIVTRLASQGSVRVDAGQVEQVLLNMAINARDAMPDGGELSIATSDIEVDTRFADAHPEAAPGSYVLFSVRDTGHGMDEETLRRVFEPFFTTKGLGKGTGLGLSMSYGIVKQFGGFILADSESGHGTTFHVYLPRIANSERHATKSPSEHPARGTETVLLIEDDPVVRSSTRRALRAFGYRVLEAGSGDQALTVAESHVGEIAIAVSDLVMPGMKARDAAERLAAMRPGMRFLFMSGFADETVHHDRMLGSCCDFVAKPFSGRELAERVRELLDRG